MGRDSLEIKRREIQTLMDGGLFPYTRRYLGTLRNHFSTLGVNGLNEMVRNFTGGAHDITTREGEAMAIELLDHVRGRMLQFQEKTGHMYNLEATPAEGTTYRFAKEPRARPIIRIRLNCPWDLRMIRSKLYPVRIRCKRNIRAAQYCTCI